MEDDLYDMTRRCILVDFLPWAVTLGSLRCLICVSRYKELGRFGTKDNQQ
jgi:hypothetical protein